MGLIAYAKAIESDGTRKAFFTFSNKFALIVLILVYLSVLDGVGKLRIF